jgi:hypothetical protein
MRDVKKLCRRLGLGFMVVTKDRVDILLDPLPYQPRKNARKAKRLLGEHSRRVGDPTKGGSTRVPIMTAYRQEALRCAGLLSSDGPMKLALLRAAAEAPNAASIVRRDAYGWFERVERGIYHVTPKGLAGLVQFGWKKD